MALAYSRQLGFPSDGCFQRVALYLSEDVGLTVVLRFRVYQCQCIAQGDLAVLAVVLGELVFVELVERLCQTLAQLTAQT